MCNHTHLIKNYEIWSYIFWIGSQNSKSHLSWKWRSDCSNLATSEKRQGLSWGGYWLLFASLLFNKSVHYRCCCDSNCRSSSNYHPYSCLFIKNWECGWVMGIVLWGVHQYSRLFVLHYRWFITQMMKMSSKVITLSWSHCIACYAQVTQFAHNITELYILVSMF